MQIKAQGLRSCKLLKTYTSWKSICLKECLTNHHPHKLIVCWYVWHQMFARPHQQPPAAVKFHNLASWRKKNPSSSVLSQILCPGRPCPSGTHSDRSNGPEIEILLWKAHTLSNSCFMKNNLGSVILWPLLCESCLFFLAILTRFGF